MGLSIGYRFHAPASGIRDARRLIDCLHQRACTLPFSQVTDVFDLRGDACDDEAYEFDDVRRWLAISAISYLPDPFDREVMIPVLPKHLVAFLAIVGDGSEPAPFALARYPGVVEIRTSRKTRQRRRTGLTGWRGGGNCKTQYASNPRYGGAENFLRCHLAVIQMLDYAQDLGILEQVSDEGEYWEQRDRRALVSTVTHWNEMVAGVAGQLKDMLGSGLRAEITAYPNFEHLEARGRQDLED